MRILIIEPHASGHHANYLAWLARACRARKWRVVIATTPLAMTHPLIASMKSDRDSGIEFHAMQDVRTVARPTNLGLLRREFEYWRLIRAAVRGAGAVTGIDAIILPYLDYCYHAMAILGTPFAGRSWCAISMRLSVEIRSDGSKPRLPLKWRFLKRLVADPTCKSLFVINPSVREMPLRRFTSKLVRKIRYLPDPADLWSGFKRDEARAALGISNTALAILVFGSIDERKGVDALLAALVSSPNLNGCVVILAGSQSEGVRRSLDTPAHLSLVAGGRVLALDHYLDEIEQARVFCAADLVWVGYRNHRYMSGVLVLAGKAGVPALGTSVGEIGRLIGGHSLGAIAMDDSPGEIARALGTMLDADARAAAGRRIEAFFSENSVENFTNTVLSAFEQNRS